MSVVNQWPDSLSFSGNLKSFEITSATEVTFVLQKGATTILHEKYAPNPENQISINVGAIVDRLLDVFLPVATAEIVTEQTGAVIDFSATIDAGTPMVFRVIKGGVHELDETASDFVTDHFLSWQPQAKITLQTQPEWLGIYPLSAGVIRLKAYYPGNASYTGDFAVLEVAKLYSINTRWGVVSSWLIGEGQSGQAVAWDVWYEVQGVRLTPVQRYQLVNEGDEVHVFIWTNTLGGIDSVCFTGACEQDYKLIHKNALFEGDTIDEYAIEQPREFRQSTGYLERYEAEWIADFFYSRKKYMVRFDGAVKRIAVTGSKIVATTQQDEVDYELTYRLGEDLQLLNLDRVNADLPAPEGLDAFFLTELLSGLTVAQYADNLAIAVQSPFSNLWQQLSIAQLWGGLLPSLVDGKSITYVDGKLTAIRSDTVINNNTWTDIQNYINHILNVSNPDSGTRLISGSIPWKSGLTFSSTDLVYKLLGIQYTAAARELTCEPSDPDLPRMDVIYVDTNSNSQIAKGTPAENPSTPVLGPTQFALMTVLIAAGATTPSNLEVTVIYDENIEWATTESHDPDITVNFNSVQSPYSGGKCAQVALAIPDQAVSYSTHYVGEKFGGGVIVQLDATGRRGLIAAENDTVLNVYWSPLSGYSVYSTGATGLEIGAGQSNSNLMLANDAARNYAVSYCANLVINGFEDWYMPSLRELELLYANRWVIGYFANKTYWSSSENGWNGAWCLSFANGVNYSRLKNNAYCVRAIRSFDETSQPLSKPVTSYPPADTTLTFTGVETLAAKDGILTFYLKSSKEWLQNTMLMVESYLGSVLTGRVVMTPQSHLFDYQPGNDTWQQVVLPMYYFSPSNAGLDRFRITLAGSWPNNMNLCIDSMQYQHSDAVIPGGVVNTTGTFGSDSKNLQVTIDQDGKVTDIKELSVPDWLDFTFADIATPKEQGYVLILKARVPLLIESIDVSCDEGYFSFLVWIQNENSGVTVGGMDWQAVDYTVQEYPATSANLVQPGDMVKIRVSEAVNGAKEFYGQLNFKRI
jgi:hypothetical protein